MIDKGTASRFRRRAGRGYLRRARQHESGGECNPLQLASSSALFQDRVRPDYLPFTATEQRERVCSNLSVSVVFLVKSSFAACLPLVRQLVRPCPFLRAYLSLTLAELSLLPLTNAVTVAATYIIRERVAFLARNVRALAGPSSYTDYVCTATDGWT